MSKKDLFVLKYPGKDEFVTIDVQSGGYPCSVELQRAHIFESLEAAERYNRIDKNQFELCSLEMRVNPIGATPTPETIPAPPMVEITRATQEELSQAWPAVTYKGREFFNRFYDALKHLQTPLMDRAGFDECAEVFVGYLPKQDSFVVGWDAWYEYEGCGSFCYTFKFDSIIGTLELVDGTPAQIERSRDAYDIFYGHKSEENLFTRLHKLHPDMLDLRLD